MDRPLRHVDLPAGRPVRSHAGHGHRAVEDRAPHGLRVRVEVLHQKVGARGELPGDPLLRGRDVVVPGGHRPRMELRSVRRGDGGGYRADGQGQDHGRGEGAWGRRVAGRGGWSLARMRRIRPRNRLGAVERERVAHRREHERAAHPGRGHDAPDVEEQVLGAGQHDRRLVVEIQRAEGQQDAELGRAHLEHRHPEDAPRVGRQVGLGGDHQVGDGQRQRHLEGHVRRQPEPAEEQHGPRDVDDVVDVEAVHRPLLVAHPGQRAVEAVSEPVHGQREDDDDQRGVEPVRRPVRAARERHAREPEGAQVIRVDRAGQPLGDPNEGPLLDLCEKAPVLTDVTVCGVRAHCSSPPPAAAPAASHWRVRASNDIRLTGERSRLDRSLNTTRPCSRLPTALVWTSRHEERVVAVNHLRFQA